MPLRRGRAGREPVERPEAAAPDADEIGSLPVPIPGPAEGVGVVGLAVEDIGSLPTPIPEPAEGTVGEPPVLLAREPDTAESALDIGTLRVPVPEPAGWVGVDPIPMPEPAALAGMDTNPVILPSGPLEAEGVGLSYVEDTTPPPPPPRSENPDDPFHDEDVEVQA